MKKCNKCNEWKNESEFCKDSKRSDGLQYVCKCCNKRYRIDNKDKAREYYNENKEDLSLYSKEYNEKNKELVATKKKEYYEKNKEQRKQYRQEHKEEIKEYSKQYSQKHKAEHCARSAKRRANKLNATPAYADLNAINRIYRKCHLLSVVTSRQYHVDHIIPLQSKLVCGLHHEGNLRILTASENCIKHNSFEPIIIDY